MGGITACIKRFISAENFSNSSIDIGRLHGTCAASGLEKNVRTNNNYGLKMSSLYSKCAKYGFTTRSKAVDNRIEDHPIPM